MSKEVVKWLKGAAIAINDGKASSILALHLSKLAPQPVATKDLLEMDLTENLGAAGTAIVDIIQVEVDEPTATTNGNDDVTTKTTQTTEVRENRVTIATKNQGAGERTYTQEEVDKAVQAALAKEQTKETTMDTPKDNLQHLLRPNTGQANSIVPAEAIGTWA